jgi:hypothetical protein
MGKVKSRTIQIKPRARPQTARKRSKRASTAASKTSSPLAAPVHENESEDQAGAYGDDRGETDVLPS